MRIYKKEENFSYTIGVFPTLELLQQKPEQITQIYISSRTQDSTGVTKLQELAKAGQIKVETNDAALLKLTRTENHFAAAVFNKYACDLDAKSDHLLLVNPSDMGNLGTIIRTMLGFDVKNLALIKPAVDIFDPKVIRASMGAVFKLNFEYFDSFADYQKQFDRDYYPFMTGVSQDIDTVKFSEPVTLIFGNEGAGLPESFAQVGQPVRIEQSREIDSLNLAVAAAIGLRELYKQRQANL